MLAIGMLFVWTAAAAAQDAGQVGLTMGYPASIGVIWHVSDRVAVRPEISLQQIASMSTSVITSSIGFGSDVTTVTNTTQTTTDQWAVGVGASALFYVHRWDALRTYVSPRFVYTRNASTNVGSLTAAATSSAIIVFPNTSPQTTEFTQQSYFVSGSFGAQYAVGAHFGVFGEVGFGYSHNTTASDEPGAGNSSGHTMSTRSGVGVILYF
ncbi:MAG TPA: hypothetical protein VFA27_05185 [Vicinamibacterales bacterium]|nr:hypothetical protein [Vicinamibacterales bacterium]